MPPPDGSVVGAVVALAMEITPAPPPSDGVPRLSDVVVLRVTPANVPSPPALT